MRNLMMTTAIVAATSFGAVAQTGSPSAPETGAQVQTTVPAFLASAFTGQIIHALDSAGIRADGAEASARFLAERDAWQNVGTISDIVLTQDGEIQGVLIDIGGFLGFFARTVMIDMDDLHFVADPTVEPGSPERLNHVFIVATLSRAQLEALPEWDAARLTDGFAASQVSTVAAPPEQPDAGAGLMADPGAPAVMPQGTALAEGEMVAPNGTPEGYVVVDAGTPRAEQLLSAEVYDASGERVGSVSDATLTAGAEGPQEVIIDVGGLMGMGAHTVALPIDTVEVLWNADDDRVRLRLPMTRAQLEALPEYRG